MFLAVFKEIDIIAGNIDKTAETGGGPFKGGKGGVCVILFHLKGLTGGHRYLGSSVSRFRSGIGGTGGFRGRLGSVRGSGSRIICFRGGGIGRGSGICRGFAQQRYGSTHKFRAP